MRNVRQRYLYSCIALILLGALVFYTNYERETNRLTPNIVEETLLDYHAPSYDPFPHHLLIRIEVDALVEIREATDGDSNTIFTDEGLLRFTIHSDESMVVVLRNINGATGTVKTTFYCDSWNYLAYLLLILGTVSGVLWFRSVSDDP